MSNSKSHAAAKPFAHLNKFLSASEDYHIQEDTRDLDESQWLSNEQNKDIFKKAKSNIKDKGYI